MYIEVACASYIIFHSDSAHLVGYIEVRVRPKPTRTATIFEAKVKVKNFPFYRLIAQGRKGVRNLF